MRFGPLLYTTVAISLPIIFCTEVNRLRPSWRRDWETWKNSRALRDPDPLVRMQAARDLHYSDESGIRALSEALQDRDADVRFVAATALGEQRGYPRSAVPALVVAARDPDVRVRRAVAGILGRSPSDASAVFGVVREALGDEDREVRFLAAESLWRVRGEASPKAIMVLSAIAGDRALGLTRSRFEVVDLLRQMGPEAEARAIDALIPLAGDRGRDPAADAIFCLQRFGPRARNAVPTVELALNHDDRMTRCWAALCLAEIEGTGTGRLLAMMEAIAADPSYPVSARWKAEFVVETESDAAWDRSQLVTLVSRILMDLAQAEKLARAAASDAAAKKARKDDD